MYGFTLFGEASMVMITQEKGASFIPLLSCLVILNGVDSPTKGDKNRTKLSKKPSSSNYVPTVPTY